MGVMRECESCRRKSPNTVVGLGLQMQHRRAFLACCCSLRRRRRLDGRRGHARGGYAAYEPLHCTAPVRGPRGPSRRHVRLLTWPRATGDTKRGGATRSPSFVAALEGVRAGRVGTADLEKTSRRLLVGVADGALWGPTSPRRRRHVPVMVGKKERCGDRRHDVAVRGRVPRHVQGSTSMWATSAFLFCRVRFLRKWH